MSRFGTSVVLIYSVLSRRYPKEMAGRALVLKVDTEAHPDLAELYQVQSIPNFAVFRGGKLVMQRSGVAPRAEMRRWLEESAKNPRPSSV